MATVDSGFYLSSALTVMNRVHTKGAGLQLDDSVLVRPWIRTELSVSTFDRLRGDMKPLPSGPGHILPVWASP